MRLAMEMVFAFFHWGSFSKSPFSATGPVARFTMKLMFYFLIFIWIAVDKFETSRIVLYFGVVQINLL